MGMRILKTGMFICTLWLASLGAHAGDRLTVQAAGESVMTLRVDGELIIGVDGGVESYTLRTKLDPNLQEMLAKAIPKWKLVPIQQGGRPIRARAPMRITLAATEVPGGYEVKIDNVVFAPLTEEDYVAAAMAERAAAERGERIAPVGAPIEAPVLISKKKVRPPGYPSGLMRAGVEGIVLLNLRLNPDGTVADVFAAQSSLLNVKGGPRILDKARALLEQESMRAARNWTFTIKTSDPAGLSNEVALTVRVPVFYVMESSKKNDGGSAGLAGTWRYEFRGPYLPAPWLVKNRDDQIVRVSDLNQSEQVAGRTWFRLADRSVLNQAL